MSILQSPSESLSDTRNPLITNTFVYHTPKIWRGGGASRCVPTIYIIISTVSTQYISKQMLNYNWVIYSDMFRPLNSNSRANLNNGIPLDNNFDSTLITLFYVGLRMVG